MKKLLLILLLTLTVLFVSHQKALEADLILTKTTSDTFSESFKAEKISALNKSALILTDDGRLFFWWESVEPDPITSKAIYIDNYDDITDSFNLDQNEQFEDILVGYNHFLVLTTANKLYAFGNNDYGQLGNGSFESSQTPIEITSNFNLIGDEVITQISIGYFHSLAITSDNRIFTWGSNVEGELGDGTTTRKNLPVDITASFNLDTNDLVKKTALGHTYSMLLTESGRVFSWGDNYYGQLGNNQDKSIYDTPQEITSFFNLGENEIVEDIAVGSSHSMATTSNNRVFTWGYNIFRQLGTGTDIHQKTPQDISSSFDFTSDETIKSIALGDRHSGVITSKNRVFMWGSSSRGELAIGTTATKDTPYEITDYLPTNFNEVIEELSLSNGFSNFLTSSGRILTTYKGNLNVKEMVFKPVTVKQNYLPISEKITNFSTSGHNTYVIDESNRVFIWGKNSDGNIGNDSISFHIPNPTDITQEFNITNDDYIKELQMTQRYNLALSNNNKLFAWGKAFSKIFGFGIPSNTYLLKPVDITEEFTFAENETITDYSAGENLLGVITSTGQIHLWGNIIFKKSEYEIYNPMYYPKNMTSWFDLNPDESFVDLEIGKAHGILLTNQNRVLTFGDNTEGQLGDGTQEQRTLAVDITSSLNLIENETIIKIQASGNQTAILTSNNRLIAFGRNEFGTLGDVEDYKIPNDITSQMNLLEDEVISDIFLAPTNLGIITSNNRVLILGNDKIKKIDDSLEGLDYYQTPVDITAKFNLSDNEVISSLTLSDDLFVAKSSTGRLFTWGRNYYGQIGNGTREHETSPFELNRMFNDYNHILKTYVNPTHHYEVERFKLTIIPEYTIIDEVTYVTINNNVYPVDSNLSNNNSITVFIPNNYTLDETVNFEVNSLTFSNGETQIVNGEISTETTLTSDAKKPIIELLFDYELYIEEGVGSDYLLTAFANDESYNPLTPIITGTVDWNTPGTYIIKYTANDNFNRITSLERKITIFNRITANNQIVLDMTFTNLQDEVITDNADLDNPRITSYFGESQPLLSKNNLRLVGGDNTFTYSFISGNRYILLDKTYTLLDTEAPEQDWVDYIQLVPMYPYEDIDWTFLLTYITDNSNSEISLNEDQDPTIYNAHGRYVVILSAIDASGNETTYEIIVLINDYIPPVLEPIPDQILEAGFIDNFYLISLADDYSDDGVGEITLSVSDKNLNSYIPGEYYVTIKVRDEGFNIAYQTFNVTIIDTTPPTLWIPHQITIDVFSEEQDWTEYITNAFDNSRTELTISVIEDPVNYNQVGFYTVKISAIDGSGNETIEDLKVFIQDNVPPTIELLGEMTYTHEIGTEFIDPGISCSDNYDDICDIIIDDDELDLLNIGEYTVYYSATDSSNNKSVATLERTINVVDTTDPIVDIDSEFTFEIGDYEDIYWPSRAKEISDNNPNNLDIQVEDLINYYQPGSYTVTITATDESLNSTSKEITVNIVDTIAPDFYVEQISFDFEAGEYDDYDFTTIIKYLEDNSYDELTLYQEGEIDFRTVGRYELLVGAMDGSGNKKEVKIYINILDTTAPTYSLLEIPAIEAGTESVDWESFVVDVYENSSSGYEIDVYTSNLDLNVPGTYNISFRVSDDFRSSSKTVDVMVVDTTPPKAQLNPNIDTIPVGADYLDKGVTATDLTEVTVTSENNIDTAVPGTYLITYYISDTSNNTITKYRYVTVYDSTSNIEFILGEALTTINVNQEYVDGTCQVIIHGDEQHDCYVISNNVDTSQAGVYLIEYGYDYLGVTYSYFRTVFILSEGNDFIPYFPYKKEDGE